MSSVVGVGIDSILLYVLLDDNSKIGKDELWVETFNTKSSLMLHDMIRSMLNYKFQEKCHFL